MRSAWVYTAPSVTGDSNLYKLRYNARAYVMREAAKHIFYAQTPKEKNFKEFQILGSQIILICCPKVFAPKV